MDNRRSLNPAADPRRMVVALGLLVVLGLLSWFTIDSSAVLHMGGFRGLIAERDIELRWVPVVILGLFAFRTVLAYMRARVETKDSEEG